MQSHNRGTYINKHVLDPKHEDKSHIISQLSLRKQLTDIRRLNPEPQLENFRSKKENGVNPQIL